MKKSKEEEKRELEEKVFGKHAPKRTFSVMDSEEMLKEATALEKRLDQMTEKKTSVNEQLQKNLDELEKMTTRTSQLIDMDLEQLQKEIEHDFGVKVNQEQVSSMKNKPMSLLTNELVQGVVDEVNQKVIGQKEMVQDLVLSFRRKQMMQNPFGTMLLMGEKGTGKHFALQTVIDVLHAKNVLHGNQMTRIDLGLYTSQDDENLLLQDLYTALQGDAEVIVFENVELCFPAFLVMIAELFTTGKISLKKRYVAQKNQLVETNRALLEQTVSTLSAQGKYLVLLTSLKKSKVIDCLGAEVVKSFDDIICTRAFDDMGIESLAQRMMDQLVDECATKLNIKLTFDESVLPFLVKHYLPTQGAYSFQTIKQECIEHLAQFQLEREDQVQAITLAVHDQWEIHQQDQVYLFSDIKKETDVLNVESIKKELDQIVGLTDVKQYVLSLEDHFKAQKLREKQGLKTADISKHMIFTGNPGTGKTTIARIISKYLRAIGILSGGQLVEVTRADLVGRYVGHTAPLTMQVMKSALGGVLFIDEAYSLYRGKDDNFGLECIDTLVKGMEDYRDDLIVILAGYEKEMDVFLTANSGLKSRFPNIINFKDYTAEELLAISKSIAKGKDYEIVSECDKPLLEYYDRIQKDSSKLSGNGRLARNKVEEAIRRQSKRVLKEEDADLTKLILEDFVLDDSSFVE
ncbi:MAG: AAA family ATPase [Erysipelotrichaceae bacterium]|nr:AAA family ATPase [Erysipelotrichaceae bacterium]